MTGWGPRPGTTKDEKSAKILKQLQIEIQSRDVCKQVTNSEYVDMEYMFCAGSPSKNIKSLEAHLYF